MDARKAELSGNEYQREIRTRGSSGRGAGEDRRMGGGGYAHERVYPCIKSRFTIKI